jgi:hypothetical protein
VWKICCQWLKLPMAPRLLVLSVLLCLTTVSCKKVSIAANIPQCIREDISSHAKIDSWEVGSVDEYRFHDSLVYSYTPDGRVIADGMAQVRDGNCHLVCSFGGLGGSLNTCNGESFPDVAVFVRNIWRKNN